VLRGAAKITVALANYFYHKFLRGVLMRITFVAAVTALIIGPSLTSALDETAAPLTSEGCLAQVDTPLEQLYCRVKVGGEGGSLPPLEIFRGNSEIAQREILWSPARRLGLKLPGIKHARPPGVLALPMGVCYAPPDRPTLLVQTREQIAAHIGSLRVGMADAQESGSEDLKVVSSANGFKLRFVDEGLS
jgi:hypothetical protein